MINTLANLFGYQQSRRQSIDNTELNKFYAAFYGAYNLNNTVAWLDNKSQTFIDKGYRDNAAIYAIVNKIMMKDSEPVLQVFREGKGKKKRFNSGVKYKGTELGTAEARLYLKKELELIEPRLNTLAGLLNKPNKSQTQYSFRQDISLYWRLCGEFFIYGKQVEAGRDAGKFTELFVLPSHMVEIVQGDMFEPVKGYKFKIGDQTVELDPDEVLHVKTANPNWNLQGSQLRGQGALLAGLKYLQKNTESIASLYRAMTNEGAKGFVSPAPQIDPNLWFSSQQMVELKDQIQKGWEGAENRNKVAAAGVPLQYIDIAKTPTDLDTLKGMDNDFKVFCNLWGVNPAIFSDDPKYDNMNHALKSLVTDVCMPFLKLTEQAFADWLLPRYKGEADYIEFDTTEYPELQPDVKMILDTYGKHPAFTWNEIRTMLGFDDGEGDEFATNWVTSGMIPAKDALLGAADFSDYPLQ